MKTKEKPAVGISVVAQWSTPITGPKSQQVQWVNGKDINWQFMKITLGFRDFCGNLQETEADLNKKDQTFSNSLNFLEQNF